jgi:hypothetical protein
MRILVIPDTQVKPDVPTDHLLWAGKYAAEHQPDVIVHIGDHFDLPSLSSYDVGKKSFEGRRYINDISSGIAGMQLFLSPIKEEIERARKNKKKVWTPRMIFTLGNHENRINRAVDNDSKLEGLISTSDLELEKMGWEVHPYLKPVVINGVAFCHYFTSGVMGRPVSSARLMLTKKHMSCVMGHVQDRDIAYGSRADGTRMTGVFAGIYYQHEEDYLTPQTNLSWRGIWMLNEVIDGQFDELPISMNYLRNRYSV